MFGPILCMYEIETLLDQVSSVCGLPTDLIKYMLSQPLITRRIGKWSLTFSEFTLVYIPHNSVKGQALANFLDDHPSLEIKPENDVELRIYEVERL